MTSRRSVSSCIAAIAFIISSVTPVFCQGSSERLSFEGVLTLVDRHRTSRASYPEPLVVNLIKKRGISFQPSPGQLLKLKKTGATDEMIKTIEALAPRTLPAEQPQPIGPPPPPPPPPKEGYLTVTCAPVDCTVFMGTKKIGETKDGKLEGYKLPLGRERVDVEAPGYEAEATYQYFIIKENEPARVDFKFMPTRESLQKAGLELFNRMVAALGGEEGLKETGFLRATGRATVYDRAGKPATWPLVTLIKTPRIKFTVTRLNQKYETGPVDEEYQWSKTPPKEQGFEDLEDSLRNIREYQIAPLIDRVKKNRIVLPGDRVTPVSGQDIVLRAEGNPDSYVITLDSDFRPKEIRLESSGLSSGLKVLFGDYVALGQGFYPKSTQVMLPGSQPRGVEARYEKVEPTPSGVKDDDFRIKGGKGLSGIFRKNK